MLSAIPDCSSASPVLQRGTGPVLWRATIAETERSARCRACRRGCRPGWRSRRRIRIPRRDRTSPSTWPGNRSTTPETRTPVRRRGRSCHVPRSRRRAGGCARAVAVYVHLALVLGERHVGPELHRVQIADLEGMPSFIQPAAERLQHGSGRRPPGRVREDDPREACMATSEGRILPMPSWSAQQAPAPPGRRAAGRWRNRNRRERRDGTDPA